MSARAASQRRPTRREELGIASRRRIVEAAAALMAERGYSGTSIAAVSRRSGLPSGSIYWHFESKQALLGAVVEEGARRWFDGLPRAEDLPAAPAERIETLLEASAAHLEKDPEFLRLLILIALERGERDEASLAAIRRTREMARARLRRTMVTLLEPIGGARGAELADRFAALTLCVADGAFVAHHIDPETTDIRALFDLMHRALSALARETFGPPTAAG
jgi:AcrR family transcriptional regulator